MRTTFTSLAALTLLFVAACSTLEVSTDYDTTASFSELRTWSWKVDAGASQTDPRIADDLVDNRVRKAVKAVLDARGFPQTSTSPDFLVDYQVALKDRMEVHQRTYPGRYPRSGHWRGETHVHQYVEGTLMLHILDARGGKLVWQGTATDVVRKAADPEERQGRIHEAVERMLDKFPPRR